MPQRAKTPPPPQDEIFMTIHHPYPQHANMEVQEDIERVARWLGTIVAPGYFNAFYHKPSVSAAFHVRHGTFFPLVRLALEISIAATHRSVHGGDYECPILAPVYLDRRRRVTDIDAMDWSFPSFRHATRSSSKSQSAYMVSHFFHPLRPSSADLGFRYSNRAIGDDRRKLLGKHIWKEFLLNPSEGEKGRASGVFYCVYQNIRDVQKEGACERSGGVSVRGPQLSS